MTLPPLSILAPLWGLAEFCTAMITRSRSGGPSKDRGSVFLLWTVCLSSIALAVVAANMLRQYALPQPQLVFIVAFCFFALGVILRTYAIIYLGKFFTPDVAIAADHLLIDSGPYRFMRHPTYTGLLMIVFGVALSFANMASFLIVFLPVLVSILWRIRIEEHALAQAFGDEYLLYTQRTKMLIPFIY
jgi:protein-S-isoprenylcysteine O-methyltransferase